MSCIRFYSAKYLLLDTTRHHLVIIYDSASVSTIDKAICHDLAAMIRTLTISFSHPSYPPRSHVPLPIY